MKTENSKLTNRLDRLEFEFHKKFASLDGLVIGFPERVQVLEDTNQSVTFRTGSPSAPSNLVEEIKQRCTILENEVMEMRTSRDPKCVVVEDTVVRNLRDMKDWLEENASSFNYSLIIDIHSLFEHITSAGTLLKNSLDILQKIHKLDIHSVNHAITITSFEDECTKFLKNQLTT